MQCCRNNQCRTGRQNSFKFPRVVTGAPVAEFYIGLLAKTGFFVCAQTPSVRQC